MEWLSVMQGSVVLGRVAPPRITVAYRTTIVPIVTGQIKDDNCKFKRGLNNLQIVTP
jgi:hypothetical protein